MSPKAIEQTEGINIERAKVDSILIYEITQDELNSLETVNQESANDSNTFFFLLSCVFSFGISLVTTKMDDRIFAIFVALEIAFVILTIYIGKNWHCHKKNKGHLIKRIRERAEEPDRKYPDEESVCTKNSPDC